MKFQVVQKHNASKHRVVVAKFVQKVHADLFVAAIKNSSKSTPHFTYITEEL
jgi:hypothetical protein